MITFNGKPQKSNPTSNVFLAKISSVIATFPHPNIFWWPQYFHKSTRMSIRAVSYSRVFEFLPHFVPHFFLGLHPCTQRFFASYSISCDFNPGTRWTHVMSSCTVRALDQFQRSTWRRGCLWPGSSSARPSSLPSRSSPPASAELHSSTHSPSECDACAAMVAYGTKDADGGGGDGDGRDY